MFQHHHWIKAMQPYRHEVYLREAERARQVRAGRRHRAERDGPYFRIAFRPRYLFLRRPSRRDSLHQGGVPECP